MSEQLDDDGYDGSAELLDGDRRIEVTASLRGHFDPISGSYSWYGRLLPTPELSDLIATGARGVLLRTPQGEARTDLSDVDPWGRPRVQGFGAAPFQVLDELPTGDA